MEKSVKPDKKYFTKVLWTQLTISLVVIIGMLIITMIIKLADGDPEAVYIIWFLGSIGILLLWIISSPIAFLWIKNLDYHVCDDRVKIFKGILTKTQQNIPFRAITDFALERTIFDRLLGLGSIKIQTAGQSHSPTGYEGKLGGLIEYENWHQELREKVKLLHPIAESLTTTESVKQSDQTIMEQILNELKEIKENTAK